MGKRSYQQYCTVAAALDALGERWTLLLIRTLLSGPKRFKDLLGDLPGIGTNLLAARLKDLERQGILRWRTLPPPAGSAVYELTQRGHDVEPVVTALAKWGLQFLKAPKRGYALRPGWAVDWAMLAVESRFKPQARKRVRETYEYRVDGEVFHVRLANRSAKARAGPSGEAKLVLTTDTHTFLKLASGELDPEEALLSGTLEIHGPKDALLSSVSVFGVLQEGLPETPA